MCSAYLTDIYKMKKKGTPIKKTTPTRTSPRLKSPRTESSPRVARNKRVRRVSTSKEEAKKARVPTPEKLNPQTPNSSEKCNPCTQKSSENYNSAACTPPNTFNSSQASLSQEVTWDWNPSKSLAVSSETEPRSPSEPFLFTWKSSQSSEAANGVADKSLDMWNPLLGKAMNGTSSEGLTRIISSTKSRVNTYSINDALDQLVRKYNCKSIQEDLTTPELIPDDWAEDNWPDDELIQATQETEEMFYKTLTLPVENRRISSPVTSRRTPRRTAPKTGTVISSVPSTSSNQANVFSVETEIISNRTPKITSTVSKKHTPASSSVTRKHTSTSSVQNENTMGIFDVTKVTPRVKGVRSQSELQETPKSRHNIRTFQRSQGRRSIAFSPPYHPKDNATKHQCITRSGKSYHTPVSLRITNRLMSSNSSNSTSVNRRLSKKSPTANLHRSSAVKKRIDLNLIEIEPFQAGDTEIPDDDDWIFATYPLDNDAVKGNNQSTLAREGLDDDDDDILLTPEVQCMLDAAESANNNDERRLSSSGVCSEGEILKKREEAIKKRMLRSMTRLSRSSQ